MIYLFDTDHMSLIEHGGMEYERIKVRLRTLPPDDVATTIISYEEQNGAHIAASQRRDSLWKVAQRQSASLVNTAAGLT